MIAVPAIDLIGGRCVRLAQGDFARETEYSDSPVEALAAFERSGASEIHLVDLDGARERHPVQHDLFATLLQATGLKLQLAGGFRTLAHVRRMLDAGAARVVIGSLALDDPPAFQRMLDEFGPDRLTLALDVRLTDGQPMVALHGWTSVSGETLDAVVARFTAVRHLLVTDIGRDGMLQGPNLPLMVLIRERHPDVALQASGGVASLDDLDGLRRVGAARAIVGKAIWEGRFTVEEAISGARG